MELVSWLVSSSVAQTTSCRMVGVDVCVWGGVQSCPNLGYHVAFVRSAGGAGIVLQVLPKVTSMSPIPVSAAQCSCGQLAYVL